MVTALLICFVFGPFFIRRLRKLQIGQRIRSEAPESHQEKEGTPTMGGVFVIGSILLSVFLWADLGNHYVIWTFFSCLYLALLGFLDDYIKLTGRGNHRGLRPRTKIIWQIFLGFFIGSFVYFNPDTAPGLASRLDIPFLKQVGVNLGLLYIPFIAIVIIGTSNAVNLTDGLDGLAIGCVLIVSATLAFLCYVTGHLTLSRYLFIPYIPGAGELMIICGAMMGASLGFLWFNCHPATVFMGDTGSLALGGTIGVIAAFIKKELLLGILGGVFVWEALSVILQVYFFKTRKVRIFKMSPFHHHLQLSGWKESKIIVRFWIVGIILALLTLTTLKIR
jgi:phospho-N-acetylmuramoyl-pentapeptide-transferase